MFLHPTRLALPTPEGEVLEITRDVGTGFLSRQCALPGRQLPLQDRSPRPAWLELQAFTSHSFLDAGEPKVNVPAGAVSAGDPLPGLWRAISVWFPRRVESRQRALPRLGRTDHLPEALPPHTMALGIGILTRELGGTRHSVHSHLLSSRHRASCVPGLLRQNGLITGMASAASGGS